MKENGKSKQDKIAERLEVVKANYNSEISMLKNFEVQTIQDLKISYRTYVRLVKKLNL